MKRFLKWLWTWSRRAALLLFLCFVVLYLFLMVRSKIPVAVHDEALQLEKASLPVGSNAYYALQAAASQVWWPDQDRLHLENDLVNGTNWDSDFANAFIESNRMTLVTWDAAAKLNDCKMPEVKFGDPSSYLDYWRNLSWLSVVRGKSDFYNGRVKEAFDEMVQQVGLGRRVANSDGDLGHYLYGYSISERALDAMRHWLGTTNLNPEQLKEYIGQLDLLARDGQEIFVNAIKSEYQVHVRFIDDFKLSMLTDEQPGEFILRPRWWWPTLNRSKTKVLFAGVYQMLLNDATLPYSEAKSQDFNQRPGILALALSGNMVGESFYFMDAPASKNFLQRKASADVSIQATRTLMALRAYQLTHGKLPDDLSALIPEFLDKVPVDDFNGQPLHYSAAGKIIYSVGKNLKDDGGDDRGQEESNSAERHLDKVFRFNF